MIGQKQTDALLRAAVQAAKVGLWDWQISTNKVIYSSEWKRQLGYSEAEIADEFDEWERRVHPEDLPRIRQQIADYIEHPWPDYEAEFRMQCKDGSWRWMLTRADLVRDGEGRPSHMIGSQIDITEQRRTLAELERSNRALRMLSDSNQTLIRAKDEATLLHQVCRIAVEIGNYRMAWVGFAKDDAGRTVQPLAHAGADEGYLSSTEITWGEGSDGPAATAIATGKPCIARNIPEDPAFSSRRAAVLHRGYRSAIALPLLAEGRAFGVFKIYAAECDAFEAREVEILLELAGDLAYGISALRIRAERDQSSEALRKANDRLEAAQRLAHVGHWERNLTTHAVVWSDETYRIFGRVPRAPTIESLSTAELLKIIHPEDRARVAQAASDAELGIKPYHVDYRIVLPDGQLKFVHVEGEVERDLEGHGLRMFGVIQDVTERKTAEAALRESEGSYRASEQRFRQVTETIDEVFWLRSASQGDFMYVSPAYERVFGRPCESLYADPGSWLALVHEEDRTAVRQAFALAGNEGYELEYRILRGDTVIWIHDRAFPVRDAAGNTFRIAGVAEDISKRRQLEEQLRQAQKMEAVGQLAGGIAHDFNNVLAVIQLESSILLDGAGLTKQAEESLREITAAAERASNLTRQLLTFSRRQVTQPVDLDIRQTVSNVMKLLRRVLGEDIAVEARFAPSLPLIHGDPGMMEQVLMNLAINARDAMPGGGRLTVGLDVKRLPEAPTPGPYVCLSVSDTGSGIAATDLPHIFEPFFSTKQVGKGTGLGLATVFGIVQQHHGWIEVDSALGRGSAFHVFLPALEGGCAPRAGASLPVAAGGGSETILVVEDDPAVRGVTRSALRRYGYQVLEAGSANGALELWAQHSAQIQLLLTDLVLPGGLSGRQLAEQLIGFSPRLKVLYTSGYSPGLLELEAGQVLLQKPYTVSVLAAAVRRCLDGPAATVKS
jgi:PAS domain S-box-containing protein